MADSAALLVDEILPHQPMRQWVLSVPFPLRLPFASKPNAMTGALGIVYRTIATHLAHEAGFVSADARWEAALWSRNLFDEEYWGDGSLDVDFPTQSGWRSYQMPRTYGLSFTYRWD